MNNHFNLSDEQFVQALDNCSLPAGTFNHEAHLRLAWIQIRRLGLKTAIDKICHQLITFVDHVSARDKYNETLTIAAVNIVFQCMKKSSSDSFHDFILENPRLKSEFKELIGAHYSIDIFNDKNAKATYMKPDLVPFDW